MGEARSRLAALVTWAESTLVTAAAPGPGSPAVRAVAVGWATVELDRAAVELAADLGLAPEAFTAAAEDVALGASCRIAADAVTGPAGPVALVLLEPSTEGRLAATLARSDEGPAAVWLATDDVKGVLGTLRQAGIGASAGGGGPLGRAWLLLDGPVHGPHRFLVDRGPGTIQR